MDKKLLKQYSNPECEDCNGEGFISIKKESTEKEIICECVAEVWENELFKRSK